MKSSKSSDVTSTATHTRRHRKTGKRRASEQLLRTKRSLSHGALHVQRSFYRPHVDYVGHIWDGLDQIVVSSSKAVTHDYRTSPPRRCSVHSVSSSHGDDSRGAGRQVAESSSSHKTSSSTIGQDRERRVSPRRCSSLSEVDAFDFSSPSVSSRGARWRSILRVDHLRSSMSSFLYPQLLNEASDDDELIRSDIPRTFPNYDYFKDDEISESLFNILHAYSIYSDFGYAQGMAFVAGVLRVHMSEEDAFWAVVQLLGDRCHLRHLFRSNGKPLDATLRLFDLFLDGFLPRVAAHFRSCGLSAHMYASKWFLTLFAYRLPFCQLHLVWEPVLEHGVVALYKVAFSILSHLEEELLTRSFDELMVILSQLPILPDDILVNAQSISVPGLTPESVSLERFDGPTNAPKPPAGQRAVVMLFRGGEVDS